MVRARYARQHEFSSKDGWVAVILSRLVTGSVVHLGVAKLGLSLRVVTSTLLFGLFAAVLALATVGASMAASVRCVAGVVVGMLLV